MGTLSHLRRLSQRGRHDGGGHCLGGRRRRVSHVMIADLGAVAHGVGRPLQPLRLTVHLQTINKGFKMFWDEGAGSAV